MLNLRIESLLDQVPEFLSRKFRFYNLGLSGTSAFDSMPIGYLTKHTVLRNFEVRPSSHPKLRVSHEQQLRFPRSSFPQRFFMCFTISSFALASHEAGVRTAAESKSRQSSLTQFRTEQKNLNRDRQRKKGTYS